MLTGYGMSRRRKEQKREQGRKVETLIFLVCFVFVVSPAFLLPRDAVLDFSKLVIFPFFCSRGMDAVLKSWGLSCMSAFFESVPGD